MKKIKLTLSYDGTNFFGYQVQPNKRTVQGELQRALETMHKQQVIVYASGRTDTGVHAIGQVVHFETSLTIEANNWQRALNTLLPDDMYIKRVEYVPADFHARFDATGKEYRYEIIHQQERNVFKRNYAYQFSEPIDRSAIEKACQYLIGTHDFTTFASARSTVKGDKIRTLTKVGIEQTDQGYRFIFCGDGFLYNMVRILVGTLLEIGVGKRKPDDIPHLLAKKDRKFAGKTAPPEGLYLWEVTYEKKV